MEFIYSLRTYSENQSGTGYEEVEWFCLYIAALRETGDIGDSHPGI